MPQKLVPGDVFWLAGTGGSANPGNRHRFICLAANSNGDDYLIVPICTPQPQSDRTCELTPNKYTPLTHRSYVAYHLMREISQRALDAAVFGNQFKLQPALPLHTLTIVKAGVAQSAESKPRLQAYLEAHG